ncbi:MAG: arginase family protein [Pseudomonadales bacterium]|nr:arginase family protein [Pseudomonadales bacterium]NRA16903.1 arginase family protein [Oceanospirillaceae bacterium]
MTQQSKTSEQIKNSTFMGMPGSLHPQSAKAVILGLPYDCGSDPERTGARQGPQSIRQQSALISHYCGNTGINPIESLGMLDLGDVSVTVDNIEKTYSAIEAAMDHAISNAAVPITLGGDGSVALPQMRALAKLYPDLVVLHLDAHTDAYPLQEFSNATPFTHAVTEQLINPQRSFHIGRRGSHFVPGVADYCRQLGYNLIDMQELLQRGIVDVFSQVQTCIADRPVYLCFDMDFFDPSVAPGVCSPTFGGASPREGLQVIQACRGLNIVAADINTISPPHDPQGISALLAANIVYEIMLLLAEK